MPWIELRASIPVGISMGLPWQLVFITAVATNAVLGPLVYFGLDKLLPFARKIDFVDYIYNRIIKKTQRKAFPYVEKYGLLGIALFVAIPLPGSGSWSGALAAYLLGLSHRKFAIANLLGVLIAGAIVTALSLGVIRFL
ncbi:MAG: ligand-binding protein SH3 [Candidatus Diapherotrites archaeon]|uniref:Ligand-binding protein SH3 n=1 Tax=Candidatus Iainarchaeum sp. TaxID=3101447 RepID=A0A2D6M075_9ARCH|nr:ligand-binding protein SH3 [Candidatus Diapherotrites archaeon]